MYMIIAGGQYQDLFLGPDPPDLDKLPDKPEFNQIKELWKNNFSRTVDIGLGSLWNSADRLIESSSKIHNQKKK